MVPNLFWKSKIPKMLPKSMQDIVNRLKKSKNKEACLRKAYDVLSKKYRGCKFYTYRRFFELFTTDLNKLWARSGCLHCTHCCYLMRVLLIKSEFFKEEDVKLKWAFIYYISPHKYLNVKIQNNKSINIDLWGKAYGIKLGDYAHGFHLKS